MAIRKPKTQRGTRTGQKMGLGRPRPPSGLQPGGSHLTGSSREPSLSWRVLKSLIKAVILPVTLVRPLLRLLGG